MYQLKIGTIPLPKLYVCSSYEAAECRRLGVPYIIKPANWSDDKLIKAVLWRTLNQMFPHIRWHQILGINAKSTKRLKVFSPIESQVEDEVFEDDSEYVPTPAETCEVSSNYRENPGEKGSRSTPDKIITSDGKYREVGGGLDVENTFEKVMQQTDYETMGIDDYIGDLGWYVNVEELQALKLLPEFLDDIANAIKMNIANALWMDGYNKKLGAPMGKWQGTDQALNLIILDTSGSIPSGVAGTMISLIDTLRNQANADLIITSSRSEYWPARSELPSPDDLAYLIGGCNECVQFYNILRTKILGKHWGNVIVFGDYDSPLRRDIEKDRERRNRCPKLDIKELQATRIDRIMAFHTNAKKVPGYGLWATDAAPKAEVIYNTDWVSCMNEY